MRNLRTGLILLLLAGGLLIGTRLSLHAQDRNDLRLRPDGPTISRLEAPPGGGGGPISVQDALLRPFSFPFAAPTTLADVCQYLRDALKAHVVLDLAALDRQERQPDDTVQLQLDGVRLKTGLKLLLDQVGLTFQVVPEDNLLIVTDIHGATDPIDRVLSEVKALHHDVHDLQDTVDELIMALGLDEEPGGARMRKPTIIEEVPGENKPGENKAEPKPGSTPGGATDRPDTDTHTHGRTRTRAGAWHGHGHAR